VSITARPLYLDTKLKEYTTGPVHDITDLVFVIRRAYRVNDSLPTESSAQPRWLWQRGGWLSVDRNTGRTTQIKLQDFDPYYSDVSWYHDYAAYCRVADDGERVSAIVAQIPRRSRFTKNSSRSWAESLPTQSSRRRCSNVSQFG
jgi:hypothetical protein